MKFALTQPAAKNQRPVSDDSLLDAMLAFVDAKEQLAFAVAHHDDAELVNKNCTSALAALENFGLNDQFLATYNATGSLFTSFGMEDIVGSCEAMEEGNKEEVKTGLASKLGAAAKATGNAIADAAVAIYKAFVEFLKRWLTVNGRLAASIDNNLGKLDGVDEEAFKKIVRVGLPIAEFNKGFEYADGIDAFMTRVFYTGPKNINEEYANFPTKFSNPLETQEATYGAAGYTMKILGESGAKLVKLLKNDEASTKKVLKEIESKYKAMKDVENKQAVNHMRTIVQSKNKIIVQLGRECNAGLKALISTKNVKPPKEEEGK